MEVVIHAKTRSSLVSVIRAVCIDHEANLHVADAGRASLGIGYRLASALATPLVLQRIQYRIKKPPAILKYPYMPQLN